MTETTLYEKLLGIERPWRVRDVRLALEQGDVEVGVEFAGETLVCPACGAACPGYDRRPRVWRHLDTMQYRTLVRAEVPRVRCAEHGVQQVRVPWAEAQSRFTALFEAMVIDWLKVASFAAVARQCRLSWDQVAGIQERAVRRGLSRRPVATAPAVGVDETSFQRRHEYVTVVNDLTTSEPRVLYVADGRAGAALNGYFDAVGEAGCERIQMVAMDMWPAYIRSVREHTEALIAFDKFHVAQHLGAAVDKVRRAENRALREQGDDRLVKTRYLWLTRRGNMTQRQPRAFTPLRRSSLRVARAWAIKELAMRDSGTTAREVGRSRMWRRWYGWAIRSRLEPMKKVARMIKRHWDGVIDAVLTNVTNARSEATNAKIQWIKRLGCGYRNRRALPQRHLLPFGRTRPLPGRFGHPHEFLMRPLFHPWTRPDATSSFRWDPHEDVRYALRAIHPTDAKTKERTQHGANRLAAVGLSALTVVPRSSRAGTTHLAVAGSRERKGYFFAWPIWRHPIGLAAIRALLSHPRIHDPAVRDALGIVERRRARRIAVGKFMNVTRAEPVEN